MPKIMVEFTCELSKNHENEQKWQKKWFCDFSNPFYNQRKKENREMKKILSCLVVLLLVVLFVASCSSQKEIDTNDNLVELGDLGDDPDPIIPLFIIK